MINTSNLSPLELGTKLREADEAIRAHVKNRVAGGLTADQIPLLKGEFEEALVRTGNAFTPAEQGSFLRVLDEAIDVEFNATGRLAPSALPDSIPRIK